MPINLFISYDHDDREQVNGFKALVRNPNNPIEFNDRSLAAPILNSLNQPIGYLPNDLRAKPVCEAIERLMNKSSHLIVLIGQKTHNSPWVRWEVNRFREIKRGSPNEQTWKRILGIKLTNHENAPNPAFLGNGASSGIIQWDLKAFVEWLKEPLE